MKIKLVLAHFILVSACFAATGILQLNPTQVTTVQSGVDFQPLIPAGTTGQYWRGDKSWQSFPVIGNGTVTSVGVTSSDLTVTGSPVSSIGNVTLTLVPVGTAGSYSGVTTDAKGRITAGTNRVFGAATLVAINTIYQNASGRDIFGSYTVDIASTISLTTGQTGTTVLEYADNNTLTTNLVTVQSAVNGNTGTLTIGLNLTQTSTANVTGIIPAGKYYRVRTANTVGVPTFTFRAAQEVQL